MRGILLQAMLLLLLLLLRQDCARCESRDVGGPYTADYTLEQGLRWHHSAGDIDERNHAAASGEVPPLPTARDIHDAISTLAAQSMKVLSSRGVLSRAGSSRRLLMEKESPENHPAAQLKPDFMEEDRELCDHPETSWAPGQYEELNSVFEEKYRWYTSFGGTFFLGTDEITIKSFDGAIRVRVEGDTMRLTVHSSGGRSNVKAGMHEQSGTCGESTDMLKLGMRLDKLGFMPKGGFNLPSWISTIARLAGVDVSHGLHLHEFTGAAKQFMPDIPEYEFELEIAIDATARLDPTTHRWITHQGKDIKICSPGIRFQGNLAEMRITTWIVDVFKGVVAQAAHDASYCFIKYQLGHLPWAGQVLKFVAEDNLHHQNHENDRVGGNSVFQVMLDKKLIADEGLEDGSKHGGDEGVLAGKIGEHVDPGKFLHFRVGYQMDVPTLRFASHMLQTSQIMAARLRKEERKDHEEISEVESASPKGKRPKRVLTKEEQKMLTNLKKMGFDESVLDAIWVIRDALHSMTRDISDAAAWLGGVVENVWKVLFTSGNEVETLASFGVHLDPDPSAKGGKLTAKVNRLKVAVKAEETPIDVDIFFMDPEDVLSNLKEGKNLDTDRTSNKVSKEQILFYWKGLASLADVEGLSVSGSTRALQPKRVASFFDHPLAAEVVESIINFVEKHSVQFNISTVNSLPGATIHHVSFDTKRVQVGAEVGYAGPLHLEDLFDEVRRCGNEGAAALVAYDILCKSPRGECLNKANKMYYEITENNLIAFDAEKQACHQEEGRRRKFTTLKDIRRYPEEPLVNGK